MEVLGLLVDLGSVGVVAWVVWIFVKYLERRDDVLNTISGHCHDQQARSTTAIAETTRALGKVDTIFSRIETLLIRLNGGAKR